MSTIQCRGCHAILPATSKYCPKCGLQQPVRAADDAWLKLLPLEERELRKQKEEAAASQTAARGTTENTVAKTGDSKSSTIVSAIVFALVVAAIVFLGLNVHICAAHGGPYLGRGYGSASYTMCEDCAMRKYGGLYEYYVV